MKHTPTPWEVKIQPSPDFFKKRSIMSVDGEICGIWGDDRIGASQENAAFIVKSVNCHDELVEAVTTAIAFMGMLPADNSAIAVPYQKLLNALALAKAGVA